MARILDKFKQLFSKPEIKEQVATENITTSADWIRNLTRGAIGSFSSKFVSDIYKERILFPHEEMNITQKAYAYNSYIASAVKTRANFMTGGMIWVSSDDKGTEEFLNKLIDETSFNRLVEFLGVDLVKAGNFYAERIFDGGKIVHYSYFPHPERMYIELDEKGLVKGYLQEVPEYVSGQNIQTINYYGNRQKSVRGIKIDKNKIFHSRIGVAEIPQYGRGYVACVVNDVKVLLEIERAIAIIARYKAIPKKLFQLDREQPSMEDGKVAEFYANQLSNMSDLENPFIPEKLKVDDLSYSGKDVNFEPFVNYLKKKITVALAPSFIMHGDETNYAVSDGQLEAFILTVQAERETLSHQIKKELKFLAKTYGKTNLKDFEVKFGEFDLGQTKSKIENNERLFRTNLITLNEARENLGYHEDKELGDSYFSEISSQGNLMGLGSGDFEIDEPKQE
jgi:hypothetical protein